MKNDLQQMLKDGKITNKTLEKVQIAKAYIEKKYKMKQIKEEEKKRDWEIFNKRLEELNLSLKEKELIKKDALHKEAEFLRLTRKKINIREFESVSIIGRGAFGEVRVCRVKETGKIVAIKKMRKEDMFQKNQIMHVRTEREILTMAQNPWVVKLNYSFQDDQYLYLVMDYLPGGDFMSLLMKKDILTEEDSRFYIAELILAVEAIHALNCIHRDLKPDNILIDKNGHIELSDFGLSKLSDNQIFPMSTALNDQLTKHAPTGNISTNILKKEDIRNLRKNRLIAYSTVGTPDYIAPEVFEQNGYGQEVDWWSVGVILFEMLVGYPPFFSENPSDTCTKIVNWKRHFTIPTDAGLSPAAENLIRSLVSSRDHRLGLGGAEEIKRHPFFKNFDWNNVRQMNAPFIPEIRNDWDVKYFDTFDEQEPFYPQEKKTKKGRKDVHFLNYTYNQDLENSRGGILHALEVLEAVKLSTQNIDEKHNMNADDDFEEVTKNKKPVKTESKEKIVKESVKEVIVKEVIKEPEVKISPMRNVFKTSTSPDSVQKETKVNRLIPSKPNLNKGLNIIPLKGFTREATTHTNVSPGTEIRSARDRLSPKPKDVRIPNSNLSPKHKLPVTTRASDRPTAETQYANKFYMNIQTNMISKSPSPKHYDINAINKLPKKK